MIERGRRALWLSSLLAFLHASGCTLDTHATGTRGLRDAEADGSAFDLGPPTSLDGSAADGSVLDAGLDAATGALDAASPGKADAATDGSTGPSDAGEEPLGDAGYPALL